MEKMEYFSMFSGIGGFEYGIQKGTKGKWKCVGYSEIYKPAIKIYKKHFPEHKNFGDATTLKSKELPQFEVLCGGFPCQAFSVAGKRKGFKDERGNLFFEICWVITHRQPKYIFLENVKGLLTHEDGRTFRVILSTLNELGYDVEWQCINSKHHNTPQNRERVFIIGHLRGKGFRPIFPIYPKSNGTLKLTHCITGKTPSGISKMMDRMYSMYGVSPCLTSSFNKEVVNITELKRNLTPIECERLQNFPDNWTEGISHSQRYNVLGNSVSVSIIEEITKKIEEMN